MVTLCCFGAPDEKTIEDGDVGQKKIFWYYKVILALPIGFALLQMLLFVAVFPYDTPVALKKAGDWDTLTALMTKMYANN